MIRRLSLLAAILFIAMACGQSQSPSTPSLVIGAIYPLTGPQATGGRQELDGVEAALRVADAAGDRKVRLQVIDATTPDQASAAVDTLVTRYHLPAILGTYGSTLSAAASARAEQLNTVDWETGAVADPITAHRNYVFRTVATGSALGRMAVTFTHNVLIPQTGVRSPRIVIVHVNDIYGQSVGGGELQLARALGLDVVDDIEYSAGAYDASVIAARVAEDRPDFLWDVSYLDDGVAIWQALQAANVHVLGAIGTSSAFCMPEFSARLGAESIGVYAADKPDADISASALSPAGKKLLDEARAAYAQVDPGDAMQIPAVAGFVGAWTLVHNVLAGLGEDVTPDTIRSAALAVNVPVGDSINGGGVKFAGAGALDEGQNTRAAAVVGQWQAVGVMTVLYPPAYATGRPLS